MIILNLFIELNFLNLLFENNVVKHTLGNGNKEEISR